GHALGKSRLVGIAGRGLRREFRVARPVAVEVAGLEAVAQLAAPTRRIALCQRLFVARRPPCPGWGTLARCRTAVARGTRIASCGPARRRGACRFLAAERRFAPGLSLITTAAGRVPIGPTRGAPCLLIAGTRCRPIVC